MAIVSLIQCACIFISFLFDCGRSELYPSIQWTSNNPVFASNRTHCVHPMSKVIFVCPNTATIVKRLAHSSYVDPQYENLWLVSKQSYERCEINRRTDTRLWLCDEPLKLKYYTVTFKRFSASNEPEFQPGKEYYFVATSDGRKTSINSTYGGNCRTNKMKLKFLVCTSSTDPRCKSEDMCNGVSPTQLQTSSRPTNPPVTVESHSTIKNSSCANKTHPTTTISNQDDPEKDDREKENVLLREMRCNILVGFLACLCFLLVLSTILMYKYHRKRKNRSSSSRDSASVVHKISNDSADGGV